METLRLWGLGKDAIVEPFFSCLRKSLAGFHLEPILAVRVLGDARSTDSFPSGRLGKENASAIDVEMAGMIARFTSAVCSLYVFIGMSRTH